MDMKKITEKVLTNGPARVIINGEGEATTCRRAHEMGINPDVIFIRGDGWSLAAPSQFESVAYGMWSDEWVAFMRKPEIEAKPMSEYGR